MPALVYPNVIANGQVADGDHLEENFQAIRTLLNTTKLNSTNLQAGSVIPDRLSASYFYFPIKFVIPYCHAPANIPVVYQGYLNDHDSSFLPAGWTFYIFDVSAFRCSWGLVGLAPLACLHLGGVQLATTELNLTPRWAHTDLSGAPVECVGGQYLTLRLDQISDLNDLPVTYTAWCYAQLQGTP